LLSIRAHSCSDQGDRETNEDRAAIFAKGRILLVADGMGGQRAGEVASRLSTEAVGAWGAADLEERGEHEIFSGLVRLFQEANEQLMAAVRADPGLWGLGTTLTVGVVGSGRLFFAHVGDSRLYLWRRGGCEQLTEDHTWAREFARQGLLSEEQAAHSTQRNVLTRYLGTANAVEPQLGMRELEAGDRLLLCSDGLYNSLGEERLARLLGEELEPEDLAAQLVAQAKAGGGRQLDNITALVALVDA
jgi:protein phosphatase